MNKNKRLVKSVNEAHEPKPEEFNSTEEYELAYDDWEREMMDDMDDSFDPYGSYESNQDTQSSSRPQWDDHFNNNRESGAGPDLSSGTVQDLIDDGWSSEEIVAAVSGMNESKKTVNLVKKLIKEMSTGAFITNTVTGEYWTGNTWASQPRKARIYPNEIRAEEDQILAQRTTTDEVNVGAF